MCEWGTDELVEVPIPGHDSHTGEDRWDVKAVDACIAPIVDALNKGGIFTTGSCCGHGKMFGEIGLWDGRLLRIANLRIEGP